MSPRRGIREELREALRRNFTARALGRVSQRQVAIRNANDMMCGASSIRARAERIPDFVDRQEYLLSVIERLIEARPEEGPPEYGMSRREARVFNALRSHPGYLYSREALIAAADFDSERPTVTTVGFTSLLRNVRRKIREAGAPYEIRTYYKLGFQLIELPAPS